jgi:hypothetical protein
LVKNIYRFDEIKLEEFQAVHRSLEIIEKYYCKLSLNEVVPSLARVLV